MVKKRKARRNMAANERELRLELHAPPRPGNLPSFGRKVIRGLEPTFTAVDEPRAAFDVFEPADFATPEVAASLGGWAEWASSVVHEPAEQEDVVNHPSHYTRFPGVEVIQITEHLNFCRGNAVKYIARAGAKDESAELEDLRKARWYVDREIARLEAAQ